MAELHIDDPLDEGYWESLGLEGDQTKPGDPFSSPPPGAGSNPFEGYDGPTGRSRYQATWLRTYHGVEFIDVFVGEFPGSDDTHMLIFLYEVVPDRFNIGFSRPKTTEGGEFRHKDLDYATAKQRAANEAAALSVDAGANADWRRDIPGLRQQNLADRMGISYNPDTATKGEISDKLNVHFASRVLDPTFASKESKQ